MIAPHDPTRDLIVEVGEMLDRALSAVKEWQFLVSDGFAGLNTDMEFDLRMRMRALLAEREASVHSADPGPLADADAELRARLVIEAEQAYRRLFDGAGAVACRVAATLNSAPHQFPGLPVLGPVQLVTGLAPPRPPRSELPLPARLLRVFRPGWSGIMMALIATRLLDVHLPGGVLAVIATVGAFALGGAALTGERRRQLDRRRGDEVAALRGTVEDFRLTLGKQLRDASRALQHDLRRASAVTAASRTAAVIAELKTLRGPV
ncbi:MAG: hypothetical protein H0V92_13290 [Pseudonocardiales bacterium]|nr:hypothetical protein [Pseudonocardiales bacterium]